MTEKREFYGVICGFWPVDWPPVQAALKAMETIDHDMATSLRRYLDYYEFSSRDPLEVRDVLLRYEERLRSAGHEVHELAMEFERMAGGG
jgi:hypothetical protein